MAVFLSPIGNSGIPFFNTQGVILAGGKINTYQAGSTTPAATYTDNTGGTPNANPIILNSAGLPPAQVWLTAGQNYKFVITDSNNNVLQTQDNITGVNNVSSSSSEWVTTGITPTFSNATTFTTPGNTVATYQVGRRIQATVTAGTVYGTITSSSFSSVTTVVVRIDSGALDSGLSTVNVGLISATNTSSPSTPYYFSANVSATLSAAGTFTTYTELLDPSNMFNNSTGIATIPVTGVYMLGFTVLDVSSGSSASQSSATYSKNGSNQTPSVVAQALTSNLQSATFSELISFTLGDTIGVSLASISGTSATASAQIFFMMRVV